MAGDFNFIRYSVKDNLAYIVLNRPEKRNALNDDLVKELKLAFQQAEDDGDVKAVILKAEGKAFCAGADLEYLERLTSFSFEENLQDSINLKDLLLKIFSFSKIVIAQVQGHAIAGGSGLVSVCDFSFVVADANFGYTEVKLGFIPAIVAIFLAKKVGEGRAKELLLSGRLFSAKEAKSLGFVSEVVEADQLEQSVKEFAQELISSTSRISVAMTKRLFMKTVDADLNEKLLIACEMNAKMRESDDFKKGVTSFLKKEKTSWT